MKRIIEFQVLDEKYIFRENESDIFEINKANRQLNVVNFYNAFFAQGKNFSEIEINIPSDLAMDDKRIYEAVKKLITDICTRLKEEIPLSKEGETDIEAYKIDTSP